MDQVRNFANNNRSLILNVLFVVIFLVIAYYVYKFLTGTGNDAYLSGDPLSAAGNTDPKQIVYPIRDADKRPKFRVREGGDFAISTWIYISSYSSINAGKVKPVFVVTDAGVPNNNLLTCALYPNENKMMIRAYTGPNSVGTTMSDLNTMTGSMVGELIPCDIDNVDMQRWINITVAVSGRIMDVYMDGKLTRSCILPGPIKASDAMAQSITMAPNGGFGGYFSRIRFFNYSPTPDQIYANYQAGPYEGRGFFKYIGESLGIKLTYVGAGGAQQVVG
jgi:hypothetical protein